MDEVGLIDIVGQFVALMTQLPHDQLAVEEVHLAANGLDVELFLSGFTIRHKEHPGSRPVPGPSVVGL